MISPSIGRIVWYWPNDYDTTYTSVHAILTGQPAQAMAAQVVYVHHDRKVNLLVTDHEGFQHRREFITLMQEGDSEPMGESFGYATWMPYQTAQAKAAPSPTLSAPPTYIPPPTEAPAQAPVDLSLDAPTTDSTIPGLPVETKEYSDGTTATGPSPLPESSPTQDQPTNGA